MRAKYKVKLCSYGDECQTEGCLYFHPYEALESAVEAEDAHYLDHDHPSSSQLYAGDLGVGMERLRIESSTDAINSQHAAITAAPTYEEWLAAGCLPPPNVDDTLIFNMWHYPGSGMQRTPWDVYSLMYPQSITPADTAANNLNAASQSWVPADTTAILPATNNLSAASQSWEPTMGGLSSMQTNNTSNPDQEEGEGPKSFQEWKKRGCPYPSWFYEADPNQEHDPWYDDEGVRRSLEEVYDVLYGENANAFHQQMQEAAVTAAASDPTPAELAAMIQTNDPLLAAQSLNENNSPSKGGWASIAAKRPEPILPKPAVIGKGSSFGSNSTSNRSNVGSNSTRTDSSVGNRKSKMIIIPKEVWLPDTANSDYFHLYPNPIERFIAVNGHHKSYLASVTIPKCFEKSNPNPNFTNGKKAGGGSGVALLDVHFQSAKTITPVLDHFLTPALNNNDEVWIVTGSGHHVAVGHQRREEKSTKGGSTSSGGILFNAVRRYLEEREEDMGLEFRIGKDTSGGKNTSGGAFVVRGIS